MKKALSLFLVLVLCISLCACGSNNEPIIYKIGDAANTDVAELVVTKVTYNYDYRPFFNVVPEDGHAFIAIDFTLKNVGKQTWEYVTAHNGSNGKGLEDMLWLDYNDGYIFAIDDINDGRGKYVAAGFFVKPNGFLSDTFTPLSPKVECRAVFYVPQEVVTNKDASLLVKFNLPTSEGAAQTTVYTLR